jgi:phosphatidylserine/phosphatidylglycerophosphate/cardiolipin synthase-like enzyme
MTGSRSRDKGDHYYLMTSKANSDGTKRRYRYDHAKYIIVDSQAVLLGSENYSETSNAKKPGNRGWEIYAHDASLAKQFAGIFTTDTDTDTSHGDIEDLTDDSSRAAIVPTEFFALADALSAPVGAPLYKATVGIPDNTTVDVASITTTFSPDSLSGLLALINGAKKTLKLEMMTFSPVWGKTGTDSPLLEAVEAAARRGVEVEVLLNDDTVFSHGSKSSERFKTSTTKNNNEKTVDVLNQAADGESLTLVARIANIKAMKVDYIHNKGALVDGEQVLISSINWDENSVENNREVGAVLNSTAAYQFYEPVFDQDWSVSASKSK